MQTELKNNLIVFRFVQMTYFRKQVETPFKDTHLWINNYKNL